MPQGAATTSNREHAHMGIMRSIKDMKQMTAAAPGMIDQAQQLQASAQQMQAAQAAQAQQVPQAPAAAPAADDLESISGVSLTQFAQISKGLAAYGYDQSKAVDLAAEQGIAAADWQAAVDGWNARMGADPAVARRFNDLYTGRA